MSNKHKKSLCCNRAVKPQHFSWCPPWSQHCAAFAAPTWDPGSRKSALCCHGCRAAPLTWNSWSNQTHSFPIFKKKMKISKNLQKYFKFYIPPAKTRRFSLTFHCIFFFPKIVTELTYLILGDLEYPFKFQILPPLFFFFFCFSPYCIHFSFLYYFLLTVLEFLRFFVLFIISISFLTLCFCFFLSMFSSFRWDRGLYVPCTCCG